MRHLNTLVAKVYLLLSTFLVGTILFSDQLMARYANFTSTYSSEWSTINDGGTLKLKIVLRLEDYDISSWATQGQNGIWLGIGFGSTSMVNADDAICKFTYSN